MKYRVNKKEYRDMFDVEERLWWYRGLREIITYFIKESGIMRPRVLDAGCGTGMNMKYLKELGFNIEGFDISQEAVDFSIQRGLTNIKTGSVVGIPFNKNTFDIVISMDVLGVLDKRSLGKAIEEFYRVLKPGGYLLIQCAALEWLRSQHDDVNKLKHRFFKNELVGFFGVERWLVIRATYRIFFLFIPVALHKVIKRVTAHLNRRSVNDLKLPSPIINEALFYIQKTENFLVKFIDLPIGSSIFIVLKKL